MPKTSREIAKELNVCDETVRYWITRMKIETLGKRKGALGAPREYPDDTTEKLSWVRDKSESRRKARTRCYKGYSPAGEKNDRETGYMSSAALADDYAVPAEIIEEVAVKGKWRHIVRDSKNDYKLFYFDDFQDWFFASTWKDTEVGSIKRRIRHGEVECLKCSKKFYSTNKALHRMCLSCRTGHGLPFE